MGGLENINKILFEYLNKDKDLMKKFMQHAVIYYWKDLFPKYADSIFPIEVKDDVLIVDSNNNALKDRLKFIVPNIIRTINNNFDFEEPIVKDIKFGKKFKEDPPPKKPEPKVQKSEVESVELTPEEIAECKEKADKVIDRIQRQKILELMLTHAKAQKYKLKNGWHKCRLCTILCPPNEILCNVCKIKEREKLRINIKKIFLSAPETPFREIQKQITRKFPHLQKECTLENIESARMELILQKAAKISYGDKKSDAVLYLVSLIRQLPRQSLTQEIIDKTLKEFQFNLRDLPPYER